MSVYDFLKKFEYDKFYIVCDGRNVTGDDAVQFEDVRRNYEEREAVLDALEYNVVKVDFLEMCVYCER